MQPEPEEGGGGRERRNVARVEAICELVGASAQGWSEPVHAQGAPAPAAPPKVARVWRGRTALARAQDYRQYLFEAGVRKIAGIPGNRGVQMMMRSAGAEAEFVVVSYWDSIDAIEGYAGPRYERVRDLPRDDEFLIDKETRVRHYDLNESFWRG